MYYDLSLNKSYLRLASSQLFCKVTKKREKCERKSLFFFSIPSASKFGGSQSYKKSRAEQKKSFFFLPIRSMFVNLSQSFKKMKDEE